MVYKLHNSHCCCSKRKQTGTAILPRIRLVSALLVYLDQLTSWRNMLGIGLTTFAEAPDPSLPRRSCLDCQPMLRFAGDSCRYYAGKPWFFISAFQPRLGSFTYCESSMPHPKSLIQVLYKKMKQANGKQPLNCPRA